MIAVSSDGERYVNSVILPKNSPIPSEVARPYELATRRGPENELDVYMTQGESADPAACLFLGRYHFREIPGGKDGKAVLDVSYAYDANTVVRVSAVDRATGCSPPMTVEPLPDDMSWLQRSPKERARAGHLTAYLAFDVSGSMSGKPLAQAKAAAHEFVKKMDLARSSVGVISFADRVQTNIPASQDAADLGKAIDRLHVGLGGSNSATPFAHIHGLLREASGLRFIVVLTDGVWSCQRKAIQEAQACAADNIQIIAIGFGGADQRFLSQIATSEEASLLTRCDDLVDTFGTIGRELSESLADPTKAKRGLRFS
jgi:Mg-chelatase subunit ChlD